MNTIVTCVGAAIAAFTAGMFVHFGKKRMVILTNFLIMISAGLCLIGNPYVTLVGRFFWGMSAGSMTCYCPRLIAEISPVEMRGPMGVFGQLSMTFGILCAALVMLAQPNSDDFTPENRNSFIIAQYFRVLFGIPIVVALIQVVLLLTCFRWESPVTLKSNADWDNLCILMNKLYTRNAVNYRIDEIVVNNKGNSENKEGTVAREDTYVETFFGPNLCRASWLVCALQMFQQLSGINVIIFYAN